MRLVLVTRRDPLLPISALRAKGHVNEVRVQDLRFSAEDTLLFLQRALERPVDERTADRLSVGLDYTALGQWASAGLTDEKNAAGGIFRFLGNWTLLGRDSGNTGTFVYKVEHRHTLGTEIAPQSLGFEVGYLGLTGPVFSDTEWSLTNVYWKQLFREGR
ncbi:MAG: hypothetical protein GY794_16395, partial [bacterium]|nr:hypothetical protein [bacterium]